MKVILVPEKPGRGNNTCLSHRHLLMMVVVGMMGLPLFIGALTYFTIDVYQRTSGRHADVLLQRQALAAQKVAIEKARDEAATHLNALALKLGQLQAQVLRLNALGSRLTRMAGIDQREFNFDAAVAQGGPETATAGVPATELFDSLAALANDVDRQQERLAALESLLLDKKLNAQVTPAGWPAEGGWVSSGFGLRADPFNGRRAYHEGVDIAARLNSPIHATGDGVVTWAAEKAGYGKMVEVTHAQGLATRYAHTAEILVKVGDKVTRGQVIARVGSSGRSTGPHVHFEVRRNGQATNPLAFLSGPRGK